MASRGVSVADGRGNQKYKKDGVNYLFHINVSPASDDTGGGRRVRRAGAFSRGALGTADPG